MIPHEKIPSKTVDKMSPIEQEELRKQLDELIACRFVQPSQSAYEFPVVFGKKKLKEQLRMCVDYRAINAFTVKGRYSIPDMKYAFRSIKGRSLLLERKLN
jgi:hypothetical protein